MRISTRKPSVSTPKLKVGFVLDDTIDTADGVQQYVLTLGQWLSSQGHTVYYLVGESARKDINNIYPLARNIKVRFNKNRLSVPLPANKNRIKHVLQELRLDIIHVQMPYSPLFAGKVINSIGENTKVIGTFHIAPYNRMVSISAKLLGAISAKTLARFDHIISVSSAAKDFARASFGIESVVLPNVVDINKYKTRTVAKSYVHIVYLGRLVERKGCLWLLKALKGFQAVYDGDYRVSIASNGPMRAKLERYVKTNNIKNVSFLGYIEEEQKPKLFASADIAVFPSTGGESFGIVLIEAMAAGSRVVLGGNNIGYENVLGNKKELLFDPTDTFNLVKRLNAFAKSSTARKAAYVWNQTEVKKYDVNNVGPKILELYYL